MYSGGTGTSGDPYLVANATDLYDVRSNLNKCFLQTADISLIGYANWGPFSNFTGVYDGGNHEITNLNSTDGGLCSQITAGTFKNMLLSGAIVKDSQYIGGLSTQCFGGTFDNIHIDVDVSYLSTHRNGVGGFFGRLACVSSTTMNKCISVGTVTGASYVGGIWGQGEFTTGATTNLIKDCYSTGAITADNIAGGFCGSAWVVAASVTTTFENCYSAGTISCAGASKGGFCASSGSTNNPIVATYNFYDATTSGMTDSLLATGKTTAQMKTQGTFTDWDFTDIWVMDTNHNNGYPNLQWYYGLLLNPPSTPTGLASTSKTNLQIVMEWDASAGATSYKLYQDAAEIYSGANLTHTAISLTAGTEYSFTVSAINGDGESAQSAAVLVTTNYYVGQGTVGEPWQIGTALELYNVRENLDDYFIQTADISLTDYADWVSIDAFTGNYDGDYYEITDLASTTWSLFKNITGAELSNIRLSGTISGTEAQIGGLFANSTSASTLTNCVVDVDITTTNATAGGFCSGSAVADTYTECIAKGNVSANTYAGGFFGYQSSNSSGTQAIFFNCYALGNVTSTSAADDRYTGGFGSRVAYANISKCYSIGLVSSTGGSYTKGFIGGSTHLTYADNYYDSTTSGKSDIEADTGATPKTTAEMKTEGTFTNWDFTDVWVMDTAHNAGYPNLQWYFDLFLSAPTGLASYEKSDTTISVSWSAVAGAVGYKIYLDDVYNGTTTGATYTITGLTTNTAYGIKVSAYNAVMESAKTDALNVTTNTVASQITTTNTVKSYIQIMQSNSVIGLGVLTNAFNVSYEKRINEIWTADFSLPADDDRNDICALFTQLDIYDTGVRVERFRIVSSDLTKQNGINIINYHCEQVMSLLLDTILYQFNLYGSATQAISTTISDILSTQSNWVLNTCDSSDTGEFAFENENILSALFSISQTIGDYYWTYDTTVYPFKLNLLSLDNTTTEPAAIIRYAKNLKGIQRIIDGTYICNKLYVLGYGDGLGQLWVSGATTAEESYIEDAASIATYGEIQSIYVDKTETDSANLLKKAQLYFDKIKSPRTSYTVDVSDVYGITGKEIDNLRNIGSIVQIIDDELGTINDRIVCVAKDNITESNASMTVQITNKRLDQYDDSTELNNWKQITSLSSQGQTMTANFSIDWTQMTSTTPAELEFVIPDAALRVMGCTLILQVMENSYLYKDDPEKVVSYCVVNEWYKGDAWDPNYEQPHSPSTNPETVIQETFSNGPVISDFIQYDIYGLLKKDTTTGLLDLGATNKISVTHCVNDTAYVKMSVNIKYFVSTAV